MPELRKPFPGIRKEKQISYGGNQMWSDNTVIRGCGCGPVAALDLLHYLSEEGLRAPISVDYYNTELRGLCRWYLPLIPHFGINGIALAMGLNRLFRDRGLPYRAVWSCSGRRLWERVEEMLQRDLPVILSIGPSFPAIWQKQKLPVYVRRTDGSFWPAASIKSHYVTVTGLDEDWARISSWGRKYYLNRKEYHDFVKKHSSFLFSNIVYVKPTGHE